MSRAWARCWFSNWPAYWMRYLVVVELHVLSDPALRFREIGHEIAVGRVDPNRQVAVVHLARDRALAVAHRDLRHLRQRNLRAARRGQRQGAERFHVVAGAGREPHRHVVDAVAHIDLGDGGAADAGLDQAGDVGNVDAVASGRGAVDLDGDLRHRRFLENRCARRAADVSQFIDDVAADAAHLIEVVADDKDHQRAVSAALEVVDHVADRLADPDRVPGHLQEAIVQFLDEVLLGFARRPGVVGREPDRRLDVRGRPGVEALVAAPELGDDIGDFRKFQHGAPQLARHVDRGVERQSASASGPEARARLRRAPADTPARPSARENRPRGTPSATIPAASLGRSSSLPSIAR